MNCPKCGALLGENDIVCPVCGEMIEREPKEKVNLSELYPMKWYKFLINFLLFASAVLNLLNAVTYITGAVYSIEGNDISQMVYATFPSLKALDVMFGIFCVFLAAFCVFVRFQLSGYKKKAPFYLCLMYGIELGFEVLYSVLVLVVAQLTLDASVVSTIIISGLIIWANYVYFKKRESLFVN